MIKQDMASDEVKQIESFRPLHSWTLRLITDACAIDQSIKLFAIDEHLLS